MKYECHDEWSPLEEVAIGDISMHHTPMNELSFRMTHYTNLKELHKKDKVNYQIDVDRYKDRLDDLNNLDCLLTKMGIRVRRPEPLNKPIKISNGEWQVLGFAPEECRDIFSVIGNTILETPSPVRGRMFEVQRYYKIFDYISNEYNMKWISAPNPRLMDDTIDYKSMKNWEQFKIQNDYNNYDISFDAANFIKLGNDIIFNVGTCGAYKGYKWMVNQFPEKTIHMVHLADDHIDGCIVPLCEGTFLCNPWHKPVQWIKDRLPIKFKNWNFITIEEEELTEKYNDEEIQIATDQGMWMNVLSIDPKRVVIQDDAIKTIDKLHKCGFEPIPIKFRHGRLFSGGIHCCTVDMRRTY